MEEARSLSVSEQRVSVCALLLGFCSQKGAAARGHPGGCCLLGFLFLFILFLFFSLEGGIQSEFCIQNVVQYFGRGHWCV